MSTLSEDEQIRGRIDEIARKHAAEYPNIHQCDAWEQLYAIASTLEGQRLALDDMHRFTDFLITKIHGENAAATLYCELIDEFATTMKVKP
jgi:hypothetical protein